MGSNTDLIGNNLSLLCSAAAADVADVFGRQACKKYELIIRQQPRRSRVGSISEKLDRRPIDPPPIIQLIVHDPMDTASQSFTVSPAFFMHVMLMDELGERCIKQIKGHRADAMAGSMVSSLHTLRDSSMAQGAYFVFSDLSVRMEGAFRLRFDLFEITGDIVINRASSVSNVFSVYSPKRFPGMMGKVSGYLHFIRESTRLSKLFADQGLRIRIRTEAGTRKRGKKGALSIVSDNQPDPKKPRYLRNGTRSPAGSFGMGGPLHAEMFGHAAALASHPVQQFSDRMIHPSAYAPQNMLVFQQSHFPAFSTRKSNDSSMCNQNRLHYNGTQYEFNNRYEASNPALISNSYNSYEHQERNCADSYKPHTLSLDDIATAALLDSISCSSSHSAYSQAPQLIPNSSYPGLNYSPDFGLNTTTATGINPSTVTEKEMAAAVAMAAVAAAAAATNASSNTSASSGVSTSTAITSASTVSGSATEEAHRALRPGIGANLRNSKTEAMLVGDKDGGNASVISGSCGSRSTLTPSPTSAHPCTPDTDNSSTLQKNTDLLQQKLKPLSGLAATLSIPLSNYRITALNPTVPNKSPSLQQYNHRTGFQTDIFLGQSNNSHQQDSYNRFAESFMQQSSTDIHSQTQKNENSAFAQVSFGTESQNGQNKQNMAFSLDSIHKKAAPVTECLDAPGTGAQFGRKADTLEFQGVVCTRSDRQTSGQVGIDIAFPHPMRNGFIHSVNSSTEPWCSVSAIDMNLTQVGQSQTH